MPVLAFIIILKEIVVSYLYSTRGDKTFMNTSTGLYRHTTELQQQELEPVLVFRHLVERL